MARALQKGDTVWAASGKVGLVSTPFALCKCGVATVEKRSVVLKLPNGQHSDPIGSSSVHRMVGFLLLRIGDLKTETSLLDPLTKSIHHFSRLLLPEDSVRLEYLRSMEELKKIWNENHGAYSHVILIGHGSKTALTFANDGAVTVNALSALLTECKPGKKVFLSLCCETGYATFAKVFSQTSVCEAVIAPTDSVHGAIASQFCQTFLAHHLLEGRSTLVAFKKSRGSIPGSTTFCHWRNGVRVGDQ